MSYSQSVVRLPVGAAIGSISEPKDPPSSAIVGPEPAWRMLPEIDLPNTVLSKVTATRWQSVDERIREVAAETDAASHVVAIVLRRETVRLSMAGRLVHDGIAGPGMVHVTAPATSARCIFQGAFDVLHLHVPNELLTEYAGTDGGHGEVVLDTGHCLSHDPISERLAQALIQSEDLGEAFGRLHADHVGMAIVSRLLATQAKGAQSGARPKKVEGLVKWRLKRATDYIDAKLGEPITLADLAAAVGLTRMYFAAQFRAATGLRPHEFLLRRRIETAQQMLLSGDRPLVDIAMQVGFQNQAHFTNVFRRFVGQPPRAWREANRATA